MKKNVDEFTIVSNSALNKTNYHVCLQSDTSLPDIIPGQFTNVDIPNNKDIFLRRPFSFFDVDYEKKTVSLLVKILGRGSKSLTELKVGSKLNLVYPLGRGFTIPDKNDKVLAVGGGSGVAPILQLAKTAGSSPGQMHIAIGARSAEDHISIADYLQFAQFYFTTEDGSLGEKGFVTDHPIFHDLTQYNRIYACGPLPMMKAIAARAKEAEIFCEVSLENLMACGFGVCLCCIEPTVKGNLCVCTEGPVFNIKDLKW